MEKPLEQTEDRLLAYLDGVCSRLNRVSEIGFVHDPEELGEQLHMDSGFIEDSVDAVMAELELTSQTGTHLNDLVNAASREFLLARTAPISIKTATDPSVPEIRHSPELLLALVLRALQLTADCAGPDQELRLTTSRLGDNAVVSIETDASTEASSLPIHLRSLTLADLVQSIGCEVQVERGPDLVRLTLTLQANASTL